MWGPREGEGPTGPGLGEGKAMGSGVYMPAQPSMAGSARASLSFLL